VGYEMNARCLKGRLRDESGQALVLAIAIVVVGLILGLTAVAFALNTSQQSVHDERYRGAQQAADAGEQQQLYLQSSSNATEYGVAASVGGLVDCIVPELNASLQIVGVQAVASDNGVCPQDTSTSGGAPSTPFTRCSFPTR
jgi:Tfp pilus assembly protein PilX